MTDQTPEPVPMPADAVRLPPEPSPAAPAPVAAAGDVPAASQPAGGLDEVTPDVEELMQQLDELREALSASQGAVVATQVVTATKSLRARSAANRALRTAVQGLALDVLAAVVFVIYPVVTQADSWETVPWSILLFSVCRTAAQTALSYAMRQWLDKRATAGSLLAKLRPPVDETTPNEVAATVGDEYDESEAAA